MATLCLLFLAVVVVMVKVVATHPAHENCIAFESSYHVDKSCQCLVFESSGRSKGSFNSANYPRPYPTDLTCILYTFVGDLDEIVEVTFTEFDLQVPLTNRCVDVVRLYLDVERPEMSDHSPASYELCGNGSAQTGRRFYSSKRSLIVEFRSDSIQTNNTGFRSVYRFLDKGQFEMTSASKRWGAECTYDFYSNRNSKRGAFFSPRFPQAYPRHCHCQYAFHGLADERVRLTFVSVQLSVRVKDAKSCPPDGDAVLVYDGPDGTGHVLAEYCGTRRHGLVTSTKEQASVEFRSGDQQRGEDQGFAASFEFVPKTDLPPAGLHSDSGLRDSPFAAFADLPPPPPPPPPPGHPHPHLPSAAAAAAATTSAADAASNSAHHCDQEFSSHLRRNGTFRSPVRRPLSYSGRGGGSVCRFVFRGRGSRERSLIIFTEFDLGYPIGNPREPHTCDDVDNIVVSVVISGGQRRNYSAFCGSKRPPMLMSSGSRLDVIFFTSGSPSNAEGFKADYYFVSNFGITTGEQDPQATCRFIYRSVRASNGSFTSPNFPGLYPRSTECHYVFHGRETERVLIRFQYFDVDGVPPSCLDNTASDYVEMSNVDVAGSGSGTGSASRVCGRKNYHFWRPDVTSDGNFFRVTFRSNDIHDATGFQASYHFTRIEDTYVAGKRVLGSVSTPNIFGRRTLLQLLLDLILTVAASSVLL